MRDWLNIEQCVQYQAFILEDAVRVALKLVWGKENSKRAPRLASFDMSQKYERSADTFQEILFSLMNVEANELDIEGMAIDEVLEWRNGHGFGRLGEEGGGAVGEEASGRGGRGWKGGSGRFSKTSMRRRRRGRDDDELSINEALRLSPSPSDSSMQSSFASIGGSAVTGVHPFADAVDGAARFAIGSMRSVLPRLGGDAQEIVNYCYPSRLQQRQMLLPYKDVHTAFSDNFQRAQSDRFGSSINKVPLRDARCFILPSRTYSYFPYDRIIYKLMCKFGQSNSSVGASRWSVTFLNSRFTKDFYNQFVDALHKLPAIHCVNFVNDSTQKAYSYRTDPQRRKKDEEYLVRSVMELPPWIKWVTFDNCLSFGESIKTYVLNEFMSICL